MNTYSIGCKINLNLHVVGRREDGYHLLDSLFYPINFPCDTIHIEQTRLNGLEFICNNKEIDVENNTLTQVYAEFAKVNKYAPNICLILKKGIPHGAGLGGGSANAAFFLKYLLAHYKGIDYTQNMAISENEMKMLCLIGAKIGADIPFFLYNAPMRVQGIGEKCSLIDASPLKGLTLLIITPNIKVNTIEAYAQFRKEYPQIEEKVKKNDYESLTRAISQAINPNSTIVENFAQSFFVNDLEASVFNLYPVLADYKKKMLELNANITLMSGSGSSIFGIFASKEKANAARNYFLKEDVQAYPLIDL